MEMEKLPGFEPPIKDGNQNSHVVNFGLPGLTGQAGGTSARIYLMIGPPYYSIKGYFYMVWKLIRAEIYVGTVYFGLIPGLFIMNNDLSKWHSPASAEECFFIEVLNSHYFKLYIANKKDFLELSD